MQTDFLALITISRYCSSHWQTFKRRWSADTVGASNNISSAYIRMLTQCPFNMAANSWGRNLLKDTVNVYNKQVRRQNAALSHSTEQVKISAEILVPHFTHVHRRCHLRCIIVKVDGTFKTCTYAPCMCTNEHYNVRICALAFLWNVIIYFYCLSLHFMQHVRSRIVPLLFNKWMTDWMNKGRIKQCVLSFRLFLSATINGTE